MVIAGLESIADRKLEAQRLLDFGLRQFKTMDVFEAGETVSKARVWGGTERFVDLQVDTAFQVALTPTEQKTVEMKLTYNGPLIAPVKAGEVVGRARVIVRGKVVSEIPVTTAKDVAAMDSIWRKALDSILIMVLGG
jgi:serine-type D-Ala-D-Ala carboxypeptidase (penicillin-binding protein 5/6)